MGHVLLVEDNALVVDAMRVLLESSGHDVSTASTVEETLARCRERLPALMLLDITLPDGSGLDVMERLRAELQHPPITVALTGHDDPALTKACHEAGCRAVLLKPVPARELMRLVAEWATEADAMGDAPIQSLHPSPGHMREGAIGSSAEPTARSGLPRA